nr:immunoglobulin heavy chain junction region [Macaca mulatta]MOX92741.1 immunoglobulin heavy chain junction region [Macaca mulatta]MOX93315.1 immunoglobulin heavy chain junction region [Macaca mulatta]MOX93495.1 immunoglobulin heavy chain junction region [Macaca mulatta]MOX93786.1 immunoglobulin heavy chain junction region [Macaca mulatta]
CARYGADSGAYYYFDYW